MNAPSSTPTGSAETAEPNGNVNGHTSSESASADGPNEVWAQILLRVAELREYAGYYVAANVDQVRLTGRTMLMRAILGIVAGLVAASVVITASALFVMGLSRGVSELVGGRLWLGQLLVSATILVAATAGVWFAIRAGQRRFEQSLQTKYELRKQEEQSEYGTDVEQRARERAGVK